MAQVDDMAIHAESHANNAPNLFVIGAPKSGTTTLYDMLTQHPQIYMCSPKEPRFFSRDSEYRKGFNWYIDTYFKDKKNYRIRGEATPTYLYLNKKTIPRIKDCLQDRTSKFIAIFRNPVDRAYSHYWFNRNTKINLQENLSFEEALASENQRIHDHPEFYEEGIVSYSYFQTGLYAEQAKTFITGFGRQNCLFLLLEDLFPDNFQSTVQKIEKFLSIDQLELKYTRTKESIRFRSKTLTALFRKSRSLRSTISHFIPARFRSEMKSTVMNFNNIPFKYPEMRTDTRKILLQKYRPSLIELEKVIDRDLTNWTNHEV